VIALFLLSVAALPAGEATATRAVLVSVIDKSGRMVQDLAAAEVTVKENGQAREVQRVERDGRPLAVAVLLDSSAGLGGLFRSDLVDPVMDFLETLPAGADRMLMTIGTPPTVVDLADPAGARAALKAKVPFGKVSLYDGLADASRRLGQKKGTRRVVITITSESFGADDRALALQELGRAAPLVLLIQFGPSGAYLPDLDAIVKWSGGRYEPIGAPSGVAKALQRLTPELDAPWLVVYDVPPGTEAQKIEVKVSRKGVKTRPRLGGLGQ
jgi:hypothetical protein